MLLFMIFYFETLALTNSTWCAHNHMKWRSYNELLSTGAERFVREKLGQYYSQWYLVSCVARVSATMVLLMQAKGISFLTKKILSACAISVLRNDWKCKYMISVFPAINSLEGLILIHQMLYNTVVSYSNISVTMIVHWGLQDCTTFLFNYSPDIGFDS